MKIVIDIPDKTYAHIRSDYGHGKGYYPLNDEDKKIVNDAIYYGTVLPNNVVVLDKEVADKMFPPYYKYNA